MIASVRENVVDFVLDHLELFVMLAIVVGYFALAGILTAVGAPTIFNSFLGGVAGALLVGFFRAWRAGR